VSDSVITLKNVSFQYDNKIVLDQINLDIKRGSFIGLLGPNGGGKTTLIKIILGLLQPKEGSVTLLNQPLSEFNDWNHIGFVSQKSNTFNKGFPATVFEVVAMGLTAKIGYFKFFTKQHRRQVLHVIKQVGMEEYTYENIGNLSGGQQQRVFIARALVSEPELLILDEPTVGVDVKNVERFYELLHQLNNEQNITLLLVTHNIEAMAKYATDVVCLNQSMHFHGKPEEYASLSEKELANIYGYPITRSFLLEENNVNSFH